MWALVIVSVRQMMGLAASLIESILDSPSAPGYGSGYPSRQPAFGSARCPLATWDI